MKFCKLSVCKEPTLYQSVHENVPESLLHSLFLHKTIQLYLLIYSQPPVVRHFTNWWHLSQFPWTTTFTRTFATSILWCYNFNGTIKWYDISCVTLYYLSFQCYDKYMPYGKMFEIKLVSPHEKLCTSSGIIIFKNFVYFYLFLMYILKCSDVYCSHPRKNVETNSGAQGKCAVEFLQ